MLLCYEVTTTVTVLAAFTLRLLSAVTLAEEFPECDLVEAGKFVAAHYDCASYVYCDGGLSFLDTCPEETYFDAEHAECVFDEAHACVREHATPTADEQLAAGGHAADAAVESTTVGSSTQVPHVGRPVCVQNSDVYYAHAQRCEYYYQCLSGYLAIMRCSFNYAWDHLFEACVPTAAARCYADRGSRRVSLGLAQH